MDSCPCIEDEPADTRVGLFRTVQWKVVRHSFYCITREDVAAWLRYRIFRSREIPTNYVAYTRTVKCTGGILFLFGG
jgi:hypothetical protein